MLVNNKSSLIFLGAGWLIYSFGTLLLLNRFLILVGSLLILRGITLAIPPQEALSKITEFGFQRPAILLAAGVGCILLNMKLLGFFMQVVAFIFGLKRAAELGAKVVR